MPKPRAGRGAQPWLTRPLTLLGWLALACGGDSNAYALAAAGLATTIGATAIYRTTTGGCWAQCQPGYICDRRSGTCLRAECAPGCPVSQHCELEPNGKFVCVDDFGTIRFGRAPLADAGVPSADAGVNDAGASLADAGAPILDAGAPILDAGARDTGDASAEDAGRR